jgi:hypothetical protein
MSIDNVTAIRATTKAHTRKVKATSPDVALLEQAAGLIAFACKVYEGTDASDLLKIVRVARSQAQRWFDEHEELDLSSELFNAMGLLVMLDIALAADLQTDSTAADPFRSTLYAARNLLARIRAPSYGVSTGAALCDEAACTSGRLFL